jgi:polygalacturonase
MTVLFENTLYLADGSITKRTPSARAADILNVLDFGATGLGIVDDGPAIQAAFNAAFGPPGSPHGNANRFLNKAVFFPAGNYKVGNRNRGAEHINAEVQCSINS